MVITDGTTKLQWLKSDEADFSVPVGGRRRSDPTAQPR